MPHSQEEYPDYQAMIVKRETMLRDGEEEEKNVPELSFEEEKRVLKQALDRHQKEYGNSMIPR